MNTNKQSAKRSKQDKKSSWGMRIFYVLMLVLMLSSSVIRIAGASRHSQGEATLTPQVNSAGNGSTDRVFVFHKEEGDAGTCADLVIPAAGSGVYSNCGTDVEKQYDLSDTERTQLDNWIQQFQPVNYDHTDPSQVGNITTQFYLNGQGSQVASKTDVQEMLQFADTLVVNIRTQP
jgi:hypothetical protein